MGTRGLTGITFKGERRFAYQQYDSYPEGVGADVLAFARSLQDPAHLNRALIRAERLVTVDEAASPTAEQITEYRMRDYAGTPWRFADPNVSSGTDWYSWLRKTQGLPGEILASGFIASEGRDPYERDVFIEWSWEIDLDRRVFAGYVGEPTRRMLEPNETLRSSEGRAIAWSFDALPYETAMTEAFAALVDDSDDPDA